MKPAAVYLHIPFCVSKCAYCDFCSYSGLDHLYSEYTQSLEQEIGREGSAWDGVRFDALYVGGGTPTVLPVGSLTRLIESCRDAFSLAPGCETSVEANPGTVTADSLGALRRAGVNRLSLGVQSLHNDELLLLGRIHTAEGARRAYDMARAAGFTNVNLDLIYGLPGQGVSRWEETLRQALRLAPEHLSLYGLMVADGTPLAGRVASGDLPEPSDEVGAEMYRLTEDMLRDAGYIHYEISNWARRTPADADDRPFPSLACQHNLTYWHNGRYVGLGAGAFSYDGRRRYGNVPRPEEYIQRVSAGSSPVSEAETLDAAGRMGETMMLALRLVKGVSAAEFEARFGLTLEEAYGDVIGDLVSQGLLDADKEGIRLTRQGRLLGNRVFAAFLADPQDR